jgi:hypothetical protein
MNKTAKRRWLRYLVGTIAVAVFVGFIWLDTRSKWIADRDRARTWISSHAGEIFDETSVPPSPRPAPWSLRVCGEAGVASITIDERKMMKQLPSSGERDPQLAARRVQRLFPEADVRIRSVLGLEAPFSERPPARD